MGSTPSVECGFWFIKCKPNVGRVNFTCERKIKRKKEGREGRREREGKDGRKKEEKRERGEKDDRSFIVFFLEMIHSALDQRQRDSRRCHLKSLQL